MILSKKASNIQPSVTLAISDKAKELKAQGIDVVALAAGEPDFNTPANIRNASIEAMEKGHTKYTLASGTNELKAAIISKFEKDNNLKYKSSQIIVSTGAKQCLANAFAAILNPDDEVLLAIPCWVSYPELIKLSDGVPVFVKTSKENSYKYDIESLKQYVNSKTKAILINSPNNPTGSIYTKEELIKLAEFAKEHDLIIISDEIYEKLIYGNDEHVSIASLSEDAYKRTIVINGVSKTYSMTGWRIGYAAASEEIIKLMANIQSQTTSNPNSIAQYASVEALTGPQDSVKAMKEEFKNRRNYIVKRINSIENISCIEPKGAFYVFIDVSKVIGKSIEGETINSSLDFCGKILEKEKLAVVPGEGFGIDGFIRISYATSMNIIEEGLNRLENFVKKCI